MKFEEYPYGLSVHTNKDGEKTYIATFEDGNKIKHAQEVDWPVFVCLLQEKRILRNLCRFDERRIEQSELTEMSLYNRVINPEKSVEETVISNDTTIQFNRAVSELPEIQRRRFILYYEIELTYEQIAEIEGCSFRAIKYSVDIAKEKIIKKFKD